MLERVKNLLEQQGISKSQPLPVTNGASGAFLFDIDGKYIAKYTHKPELDTEIYKEYNFYKAYSDKCCDFIPNIVFQTANQEEIFIVMQKYPVIKHNEWDENLQKRAMQLCARINAINTDDFNIALQIQDKSGYGSEYDTYPLTVSFENWRLLQNRFPEDIDASLLNTMYENFAAINLYAERLPIPKTLCHGDFHPDNFLMDGDKLIICDWQTVGINRGISDVAFFISRGTGMGIPINQNMLIEEYYKSMMKLTNEKIELSDLYKNVAATDFYVSFKFWAEHLQSSDKSRVLSIYNSMVNSYKLLTH
jgi:hypothetical protein